MGPRRQQGLAGLLVLVVLFLALTGVLASAVFSRMGSGNDERNLTMQRLSLAAGALENFAARAQRLPCPANPALATGDEVPGANATCTFPEGTLPWRAIGLREEDSFDAWGRKLSYRVYTGNKGSLTQPFGVSMVECDLADPAPGGVTAVAGSLGGLCRTNTDPLLRTTLATQFLDGKGLTVNDFSVGRTDVAFVVLSHGPSGLGGYTAAGTRLDLPVGDERTNLDANGPFTIKQFSVPDTPVANAQHFDDLLVYRRLPDLVQKAGLLARDWPDPPLLPSGSLGQSSLVFAGAGTSFTMDAATVAAARDAVTGAVTVYGFQDDISTQDNLSFDSTVGGVGGIGVAGSNSTLASNTITSAVNEFVGMQFAAMARAFAVTFNDFGRPTIGGINYTERVRISFFRDGNFVQTFVKSACRSPDGILASYSIDVSGDFNQVVVEPLNASGGSGSQPTGLLISAFATCPTTDGECLTALSTDQNKCS